MKRSRDRSTRRKPPLGARWLLGAIAPRRDREAILGDLEEEFRVRGAAGQASRWYWAEVVLSAISLIPARLLGPEPGRDLAAAGAGLAMTAVWLVALGASGMGRAVVDAPAEWQALLATAYYASSSIVGGVTAGRMTSRPLAVGILAGGLTLMFLSAVVGGRPVGPGFALVLVTVMIGASVAASSRRRHDRPPARTAGE